MPGEPRPEKVAVVTEVRERLQSSNGALLTEYRGLKVAELATLRASLRAADAEYKVFKNTLARRAVALEEDHELVARLADRYQFAATNGQLTLTQLSNSHVSRGTISPAGDFTSFRSWTRLVGSATSAPPRNLLMRS